MLNHLSDLLLVGRTMDANGISAGHKQMPENPSSIILLSHCHFALVKALFLLRFAGEKQQTDSLLFATKSVHASVMDKRLLRSWTNDSSEQTYSEEL